MSSFKDRNGYEKRNRLKLDRDVHKANKNKLKQLIRCVEDFEDDDVLEKIDEINHYSMKIGENNDEV